MEAKMSRKGFFIPVNDVPNLDELLGDVPLVKSERVSESVLEKEAVDISQKMTNQISQVDFVWGFLFFDFPEVYTDGNKIYFNGEVSKDSVNMLKRVIIDTAKEVQVTYQHVGIYRPSDMHLELYINSPGGAVSAGWDLIDFMTSFYMPIYTVGTGTVASMGVMLLLAGTKRFITKNTHVLVHQFRAGVQGKRQDLIDYMKHFDDLQKQIVSYMVAHSKLSESQITEMLSYESWMNAEGTLTNGFVDGII